MVRQNVIKSVNRVSKSALPAQQKRLSCIRPNTQGNNSRLSSSAAGFGGPMATLNVAEQPVSVLPKEGYQSLLNGMRNKDAIGMNYEEILGKLRAQQFNASMGM